MTDSVFIELLHLEEGKLFRVAHAILGNEFDAWDALQQTAEQAWKKRSSLRGGEAAFPSWIKKILVNRSLNILRSRRRSIPVDPLDILKYQGPSSAEDDSEAILIWDLIQQLSPDQSRILVLRYLADLPLKDISKELNIPLGTVKSRLNSAHSRLKAWLQEIDYERENANGSAII